MYRFQVPLKTALARSFVQQHRFHEAEQILEKTIKSSCAHLSLEEKGAIANVVFFKDEYLHYLLRQADRLVAQGKWEESLKLYEPVFSAVERHQYPYQVSPVEKKRFRQKLLLRMAEVHFCLGNFPQTLTLLENWDDQLFLNPVDQPRIERRLFLRASANQKMSSQDDRPHFDETTTPSYLLWKAHEAILNNSPPLLLQSSSLLQDNASIGESLPHILKGFSAALDHRLFDAFQELQTGLLKPSSPIDAPWKEASLNLFAECGFERMMLLTCSGQQNSAEELAKSMLSILSTAAHPHTALRIAAIHLFLFKTTNTPSELIKSQAILETLESSLPFEKNALYAALNALTEPPPQMISFNGLSASDCLFMTWFGATEDPSTIPEVDSCEHSSNALSSFSQYLSALSQYQQAMSDEVAIEQAASLIHACLELPGLDDVHPQLLHCLVDLSLHSDQFAEADELINELIQKHASYPLLPQAILSCIFAFEDVPNVANERISLCQYVLERSTPDIYTLLLSLHLFETRQQLTFEYSKKILPFELALIAREEGRALINEVVKSKEPSMMKDRIERAKNAFDSARAHALETMTTFLPQRILSSYQTANALESSQFTPQTCLEKGTHREVTISTPISTATDGMKKESLDFESINFIWGFVFGLQHELITFLEQNITSESAFNELPTLLESSVDTLRQDLLSFTNSIPQEQQLVNPQFLDTCLCLTQTGEIFTLTFRRELEQALIKTKEFSDDSWPSSRPAIRSLLFLAKNLRESTKSTEALSLLSPLQEMEIKDDVELALEIAMEKSLCLRELHQPDKAMALLAWVINGPYASSLRVKAMILRADLYLSLRRTDLAVRQLESVAAKGGEWGTVADRKLRELYGTN